FFLLLLTVLAFGVLWGYYVFFETLWNGQTPGKRLTHLRVLRETGGAIGFWEALIRNLVRFVDFLPLAYAFGVLSMFARAQALCRQAVRLVVARTGFAGQVHDPVAFLQAVVQAAEGPF